MNIPIIVASQAGIAAGIAARNNHDERMARPFDEAERRAAQRERRRVHEKRRSARRAAEAKALVPSFTCAKCGRKIVSGVNRQGNLIGFVRLGGKPWCEACAAKRFPRRQVRYDKNDYLSSP